MALAILAEWYVPATHLKAKLVKLMWFCLFAVLLVGSNSVTSILSLILALSVTFAFRILRLRGRTPVPILVALGALLLA